MAETQDTTVLVAEALVRGKRSLLVEDYSDASEEFSAVCEMLTELHGATGDELAEAYLLYGRALLGCAREEAKILDMTETAPTQDSESSDAEAADKTTKDKEETESGESKSEGTASSSNGTVAAPKENGDSKELTDVKEDAEENIADTNEDEDDDESDDDVGTLQLAWEVLELSSQILSRKDDHDSKCLLAEVFSELGEVSLESSNFDIALKDFTRSLEIYEKLEKPMSREIAEANFKIGLSHALMNMFEDAVKDFTKAIDILDAIIKETPAENKTLLEELAQTKEEILLKITDVKESKEQSIEAIREQLNKVWPKSSNVMGKVENGASTSATTNGASDCKTPETDKPAADISHLVKRKRKTDDTTEEASSPKKPTP